MAQDNGAIFKTILFYLHEHKFIGDILFCDLLSGSLSLFYAKFKEKTDFLFSEPRKTKRISDVDMIISHFSERRTNLEVLMDNSAKHISMAVYHSGMCKCVHPVNRIKSMC